MSLINCKECGEKISDKAKCCPKCGAPNKKTNGCLTAVILAFIILSIIGGILGGNEDSEQITFPSVISTNEKYNNVSDFNKACSEMFKDFMEPIPLGRVLPDAELDRRIAAMRDHEFKKYLKTMERKGFKIEFPSLNNIILLADFNNYNNKNRIKLEDFLNKNSEFSNEPCYKKGEGQFADINARLSGDIYIRGVQLEKRFVVGAAKKCPTNKCFFYGLDTLKRPTKKEIDSLYVPIK